MLTKWLTHSLCVPFKMDVVDTLELGNIFFYLQRKFLCLLTLTLFPLTLFYQKDIHKYSSHFRGTIRMNEVILVLWVSYNNLSYTLSYITVYDSFRLVYHNLKVVLVNTFYSVLSRSEALKEWVLQKTHYNIVLPSGVRIYLSLGVTSKKFA